MSTNSSEQNNPSGAEKRPRRSFRDAKPLPPDHPIYKEGPQFGFVRALPGSLQALRSTKATPDRPKLTPEQRQQELERLGFKNGNKSQSGPTAFELPGPPHRPSDKG